MSRPFKYKVGDIVNGVEILRIYTRDDVTETNRKYVAVACTACGSIRENIHPCDLKRRPRCKSCTDKGRKGYHAANTKEYILFHNAKKRAKKSGIEFDLSLSDIVIPNVCPLLGIPIVKSNTSMQDNSPSLDRLIPSKGYTRGNILVISQRANRIKNDATLSELMLIADNLHAIFIGNPA